MFALERERQRPSRWWLVIVVLVVALAWSQSRPGAPRTDLGTRLVDGTLRPVRSALTGTTHWLGGFFYNITHLRTLGETNHKLNAQLEALPALASQTEELRQENARLVRLLDLQDRLAHPTVAGRVIARSPSPWFSTLTLSVGTNSDIYPGSIVLSPEGLVGQVYQSSASTSRVLCLVDRLGSVGVRLQREAVRGLVGVAHGDGERHLQWLLNSLDAAVEVGDAVVTSGSEAHSVFPGGLTVGSVAAIERRPEESAQLLTIVPAVHPDAVEEVLVLLPPEPPSAP